MRFEHAHPIQQLAQSCTRARVVVNQQPPRQVGEALLYNGILWVHPESNALNHAEGPQDKGKVGWDLKRVVSRQAVQLCSDLQQMSCRIRRVCAASAMQLSSHEPSHVQLMVLFQKVSRFLDTQHQAGHSTVPRQY